MRVSSGDADDIRQSSNDRGRGLRGRRREAELAATVRAPRVDLARIRQRKAVIRACSDSDRVRHRRHGDRYRAIPVGRSIALLAAAVVAPAVHAAIEADGKRVLEPGRDALNPSQSGHTYG